VSAIDLGDYFGLILVFQEQTTLVKITQGIVVSLAMGLRMAL
jgi:hypothetical protein